MFSKHGIILMGTVASYYLYLLVWGFGFPVFFLHPLIRSSVFSCLSFIALGGVLVSFKVFPRSTRGAKNAKNAFRIDQLLNWSQGHPNVAQNHSGTLYGKCYVKRKLLKLCGNLKKSLPIGKIFARQHFTIRKKVSDTLYIIYSML